MKTLLITALTLLTFAGVSVAQDSGTSGKFSGKSKHVTSGSVTLEKADDGSYKVNLSDDFSLDGAPDPYVAFGKNGYDKDAILGKLTKLKGGQSYAVPSSIKVGDYNEVWIWCKKFNVPLGVATLK